VLRYAGPQDEEDTYDSIVENWISARTATLEQQVAGLRLLHACLDCWLFQYPLTEENLVEKLGLWAMAGLSAQQQQQQPQAQQPAVLGDPDPTGLTAFLEEAKAGYALGEWKQMDSAAGNAWKRPAAATAPAPWFGAPWR
jgi:hypothetical protein